MDKKQIVKENIADKIMQLATTPFTISEQVQIQLCRNNMTQRDLASRLNITPAAVSLKIRDNKFRPIEIYYMRNSLKFTLTE